MDDLHKLAQRIADEAYERELHYGGGGGLATAVYHYTYRAIVDNAEDIAVLFCDSEWKKNTLVDDDIKANILDVITVIDAHNDLIDALKDILTYSRREPENMSDADAILTDILERAKEALNG